MSALFWADRGVAYVVSGGSDRGKRRRSRKPSTTRWKRAEDKALLCPLAGIQHTKLQRRKFNVKFRHRKSGIRTSRVSFIAPDVPQKLILRPRSADRRRRPRLGLVPRWSPLEAALFLLHFARSSMGSAEIAARTKRVLVGTTSASMPQVGIVPVGQDSAGGHVKIARASCLRQARPLPLQAEGPAARVFAGIDNSTALPSVGADLAASTASYSVIGRSTRRSLPSTLKKGWGAILMVIKKIAGGWPSRSHPALSA